jgi:hypothetical protein
MFLSLFLFRYRKKKSSGCQLDLRDRHCSLLIANIAYILIFSSQKKDSRGLSRGFAEYGISGIGGAEDG